MRMNSERKFAIDPTVLTESTKRCNMELKVLKQTKQEPSAGAPFRSENRSMNLIIMLVAGINIGVVLGAWWATGRIGEPHEIGQRLQVRNMSELRSSVRPLAVNRRLQTLGPFRLR